MKQMYVFTIFVQSIFIVFLSLFVGCGNTNEIDEMDVTPPAEISELNTIAGDCQVVLSWIDPLDDDFEKVEVLYSPGNNMVEVPRGEQSLLVSGLINGVSYVFTLKTVDRNGNKSIGVDSNPCMPRANDPNDHTPPAEVTQVNGSVGNQQVVLTWLDPSDEDFNLVEISWGDSQIEIGRGIQTVTIQNLNNGTEYYFTLKTVDASGNKSEGLLIGPYVPHIETSVVFMTSAITSDALLAIYESLQRTPSNGQKVAVKISTGEGVNSNHLRPELIQQLVAAVDGDIVECNTAYGGRRASTALHYQVAADRGYTAIAKVVIMDESTTMDITIPNGKHINVNRVGALFADYDFHVVLSHFKGHSMAGYGGVLKNMSIGYASSAGKCNIHSAGNSWTSYYGDQNSFLESMAESAKSIVDYKGKENYIYINVMNRLSVDCDCSANPSQPTMADIGILASLDPVALDKACLDLIDAAPDGANLRNRIANRNGKLTVYRAAEIGLGSLEYELVNID